MRKTFRFLSSRCRYGGRLARLIMIQTSERHLLCRWCVSDNLESASQHQDNLQGIWGMQDALMQATFLMPTQRATHCSDISPMNQMTHNVGEQRREERIMLYLRLAIVQNWHILPKRKQEIKKYYAVPRSLCCLSLKMYSNFVKESVTGELGK